MYVCLYVCILRGFQDAKEARERDKDPEQRLQKFIKTAAKAGHSADRQSGSFGGRPMVKRGAGKGGGRAPPPAWIKGPGAGDDDDDNH